MYVFHAAEAVEKEKEAKLRVSKALVEEELMESISLSGESVICYKWVHLMLVSVYMFHSFTQPPCRC